MGIVNLLGCKDGSEEIAPPNERDEAKIKRRLLNIFYTGDLIPTC